ncbi:MAG: CocE/NonD family hydrolase [Planctomycetota bacterium]|nr:CocE/NonD family hydrolase [Planctomycetota bacterium]
MNRPADTRYGRIMRNVKIPMRDGVHLETTIALPGGEGPFPVVLVRTAYSRGGMIGNEYVQKGIAFVAQDCRGRYDSEGKWYPFTSEAEDGFDTLEWIGTQVWCNGKIGMYGDSYLAATQFYLASTGSPYLTVLNPRFMSSDLWRRAYYCDGVFSLALTYTWLCFEVASRVSSASLLPAFDVMKLLRELPLITLDEKGGTLPVPFYRDYVNHDRRDDYWQSLNIRKSMNKFDVHLLLTGGWYDYYPGENFKNYLKLIEDSPDSDLAKSHRVIVGPWTHGMSSSSKLGQLDFGPESLKENDSTVRWLSCMLKEGDSEEFQKAPIRIFVMGANVWRDEYEWPLARTRFTKFFLHSNGAANSLFGDGSLTPEPADAEPSDEFHYDPEHPMPTLGGNHSVGPYNPGLYEHCLPGPYDQRPVERRDDMLVYTSETLEEDLEVTGPVTATIFASTTARDTDFVARLCDVYPDGRSINITEGVIRARFRKRDWATPKLIEPGIPLEYTIELLPTSNVFKKGHRIRLDITSSNFPLWDRNLNTGNPPGTDTEMQTADQAILHDPGHPSHILLPVIPYSG